MSVPHTTHTGYTLDENYVPICCDRKRRTKCPNPFHRVGKLKVFNAFISYYECERCRVGTFICEWCAMINKPSATISRFTQGYTFKSIIDMAWWHLTIEHTGGNLKTSQRYLLRYRAKTDSVILDCSGMMEDYCQLAFLTLLDNDANADVVIENMIHRTKTIYEYTSMANSITDVTHHTEFYDWFEKFMLLGDYECIICGKEYENGMPSIETVLSHLHTNCGTLAR